LAICGARTGDTRDRWPDLKGVSLASALQGSPTERDQRGMLMNYTASLAWDVDFVETLFRGQVRGEFTDEEKLQMAEGQSLSKYACFRGIADGRYKFARYFKPNQHHQPKDWATLVEHNELELYDTLSDPDELRNLASKGADYKDLILELNKRLNTLIDIEIGIDDGRCYSSRRSYALNDPSGAS